MPHLTQTVPRYRKHKASGQAVVTLSCQDFYLGPHGTKTSLAEYDRHVAEWLARGRWPVTNGIDAAGYTVVELIADYKRFAQGYYRKNGQVTNEVTAILSAAAFVRQAYGREPVGILAQFLRNVPADVKILVVGENDQRSDGTWPGRDGAVSTAGKLAETLERPIMWALTPGGAKDSREWLRKNCSDQNTPLSKLGKNLRRLLRENAITVLP
jgi:hypothetical protein